MNWYVLIRYPRRLTVLASKIIRAARPAGSIGCDHDSQRRYIYLHGTPDDQPMGVALSHGCIRLRNTDMLALFHLTPPGCRVDIFEQAIEPLMPSKIHTE